MNRRIRILMVMGSTGMGGAQAFVLNLLQNLDLSRFQVDFAVDNEKPDGIGDAIREKGCRIFHLPYFKVYNYVSYSKAWERFLKTNHYDIVHGHSTNSAAVYLKIARRLGCTTIAHSHSAGYRGNLIERTMKKYFAKKVGSVADYWFSCSDRAAQRLFGDSYKEYDRYFDIPNAINVEKYLYDNRTAMKIRADLGVANDELLCGHVGTFSQPKNHLFLLDIFLEVVKRNPKAKLVCCGTGALMPQVKEKAASVGLLDKIIFPGVVMNANEYMMAMDVFVFPSLFEGFPISIIEAEATGLPVVMSDVITKEVDLTDIVFRQSLTSPAKKWAETICDITPGNRAEYNRFIGDSKYNMKKSAQFISSLYEKMILTNI